MHVLLVEDEMTLASLVCEYLENQDYMPERIVVDHAMKGQQALTLIEENTFDVLVLDINLPDMSGFQVCKTLRQRGINLPTIMLTARDSLDDKAQGFSAGADDYLVKPFAMAELVMRLQALQQRGKRSHQLQQGELLLAIDDHHASIAGYELSLTADEWRLLLLLVRADKVLSRHAIMLQLWPDESGTDDALKMLIHRLRKTIQKTLQQGHLAEDTVSIKSLRNVGVVLQCR